MTNFVYGYVKDAAGNPIGNVLVHLEDFSTGQNFYAYSHIASALFTFSHLSTYGVYGVSIELPANYAYTVPGDGYYIIYSTDVKIYECSFVLTYVPPPPPENAAPNTPGAPTGPNAGTPGISYNYSGQTTDPDGDDIYYLFSWGDGSGIDWTGWVASGQDANAPHTFANAGTFSVQVAAVDSHGAASGWSSALSVVISPIPNSSANRGAQLIGLTWKH